MPYLCGFWRFANAYEHNNGKEIAEKALRSMGFYDENGFLANGAVLFQDGYDGRKTQVQCSVFSGFTKGSERIVTINRFQGDLISSILTVNICSLLL